jgi:hypothetical protein
MAAWLRVSGLTFLSVPACGLRVGGWSRRRGDVRGHQGHLARVLQDERGSHLMADPTMHALPAARNFLISEPDLLRGLVGHTVNALLSEQVDALCGAGWGERSPERTNQRTATARALGYPFRHDRPEAAKAARGQLLPRLAARPSPPRGKARLLDNAQPAPAVPGRERAEEPLRVADARSRGRLRDRVSATPRAPRGTRRCASAPCRCSRTPRALARTVRLPAIIVVVRQKQGWNPGSRACVKPRTPRSPSWLALPGRRLPC